MINTGYCRAILYSELDSFIFFFFYFCSIKSFPFAFNLVSALLSMTHPRGCVVPRFVHQQGAKLTFLPISQMAGICSNFTSHFLAGEWSRSTSNQHITPVFGWWLVPILDPTCRVLPRQNRLVPSDSHQCGQIKSKVLTSEKCICAFQNNVKSIFSEGCGRNLYKSQPLQWNDFWRQKRRNHCRRTRRGEGEKLFLQQSG